MDKKIDFLNLTENIVKANAVFTERATQSINRCLTIRNWLFGYYISEYEYGGVDRAEYGDRVLESLAKDLQIRKIPSTNLTSLKIYKQFYQTYKVIGQTLSDQLEDFTIKEKGMAEIGGELSYPTEVSIDENSIIAPKRLLKSLSFSHFVELIKIEDSLKRNFYEMECVKSTWSVRELKRQISSLYFERTGLSKDKKRLVEHVRSNSTELQQPRDIVRDPFVFEFLGLKSKEVMYESDLQNALLDKLQDFLLELGKGVCFEARNKRILIGENYYFIDAVFYHRILKRSILVELKLNAFNHENIGQLKTYLKYYEKHEMHEGDNPPIGILLCAEKDHALVEYAVDEKEEKLFVSKYKLELPTKEELERFIEKELQGSNAP